MVSAGVVIPMTKRTRLDLSYRYTDAGEITIDVGDITIERYRQDSQSGPTHPDICSHYALFLLEFRLCSNLIKASMERS